MKPLEGVRVLELTSAVAGPFAGRLLAQLGADVIKIEQPGGDFIRGINRIDESRFSAMFQHSNAGKRAITLDLKNETGLRIAHELARRSDVVLENYSPGVMDRLGMGYADLSFEHPELVMCSISTFGQTGSHRSFVGADPVGVAMSGMAYMTGEPDGPPFMVNTGIADTSTGTQAALAIVAALHARKEHGRGAFLDVAMCDVMLTMDCCNVPIAAAHQGDSGLKRYGNHNRATVPCGVYEASDGHMLIQAWGEGRSSLWGRLCVTMGRPELITDERTRTNPDRIRNRDVVDQAISEWLRELDRASATTALNQARVITGPALSPDEVVRHTVTQERSMIQPVEVDGQVYGAVNAPWKSDEWEVELTRAPFEDEHGASLLDELGSPEGAR